jgi:hypothetical protein
LWHVVFSLLCTQDSKILTSNDDNKSIVSLLIVYNNDDKNEGCQPPEEYAEDHEDAAKMP